MTDDVGWLQGLWLITTTERGGDRLCWGNRNFIPVKLRKYRARKQATWLHESRVSCSIFGESRDWLRERLALLRENPPSWLVLWWYWFCNELVHVLKFPFKGTDVHYPGFLFITISWCWLG
jgi:hypothetical protein